MNITEVVAALIWDGNKFMICQRPAHKARALLWEFVGGKVEPGETKEQALKRECQEELAITLYVGDVFMDVIHEYPDITVHLTLFNAIIAEGVPQKLEHNDIKWITPAEIPNYDFCPADEEILKEIMRETVMTREEMLKKLSTVEFEYIDPPSDWEDIGFTERPIWVNSKGYGYMSCDDPSNACWDGQGIEQEKWSIIRKKLAEGTLEFEDVKGTILEELLDVVSYGEFYEDADPCEYLEGLLALPENQLEHIYCMDSFDGWSFYSTEEAFDEAYKRDEYDYAWEELTDKALTCWISRLFDNK